MTELKIEYLSPGEIKPRHRGWRTHKPELYRTLDHSIRTNGLVEPVLVDSENRVMCGSAVVEAAARLGLNRIPVLRVEHLSDAQLRAYAVSAAKMAEMSGFDEDILALELQDVEALLGGLDFTNLGFATGELDRILGLTDMELDARIDEVPAARPDYVVSKVGNLWLAEDHRLYNGNALEAPSYPPLMDGELAELILSDLPYNLRADTISGNGKFKHGDFVQAAGELSRAEFTRFLTRAMRHTLDRLSIASIIDRIGFDLRRTGIALNQLWHRIARGIRFGLRRIFEFDRLRRRAVAYYKRMVLVHIYPQIDR